MSVKPVRVFSKLEQILLLCDHGSLICNMIEVGIKQIDHTATG